MSAKTKIVVLHMKEVVYTAIFLLFLIIFAILMFFMFGPGKAIATSSDVSTTYVAGIYRTPVKLNNNTFDVEVTVDSDQITSIRLTNLSESTTAMFPLMEPALENLSEQIYEKQSVENLNYSSDQKYTSMLLINAIETALGAAKIP